jgi:hypothetical protein
MGNKVLVSVAVGILVGAGAVLLLRPTPLVIKVANVTSHSPNPPQLSPTTLTISQSKDAVQWQAIPSNMVLSIEFEQKIFANAEPTGGRYRVKCSGGICDSGAALATLPSAPPDGYHYWYGLADSSTSPTNWGPPDGRIIIVRP